MSLQTWKQYGGKLQLPTMNNITAHTIVVDSITIRENYEGLLTINGVLNVNGNTIINENAQIDGNVFILGNLEIDKNTMSFGDMTVSGDFLARNNLTVQGSASFNGSLEINNDLITTENVIVGKKLMFGNTVGKYLFGNTYGVGLNTYTPQYGFDIVTDNTNGFSVYSSQPTNTNILAQNENHFGILTTTSDVSSSFQFYNDTILSNGIPGAKIQYNSGGELTIDTSNTTLYSGMVVSKDRSKQGHYINETVAIYDVSDGLFMEERFDDSTLKKGQALALVTSDDSSITFMNLKTSNNNGISMGGGIYPMDKSRSMGIVGWTDVSSQFIPSWNVVSGNSAVLNRSTIGINTLTNRTDKYVLDINGPVHLTHEQIAKTYTTGFEIKQVLFGDTSGKGIAIGSPSSDEIDNYKQDILITYNRGETWNINRNLGIYGQEDVEKRIHFLTGTACQNFVFVSAYDPRINNNNNDGYIFYSIDYGINWSEINNFIKDPENNFIKDPDLRQNVNVDGMSSFYIDDNQNSRIRVFITYKKQINNQTINILTYFDVPIDVPTNQNELSGKIILPILKYTIDGKINYESPDTVGDITTYNLSQNLIHNANNYSIYGTGTPIGEIKYIKNNKQGYVYLVGTINANIDTKILWVNYGLEQPTDNTKYQNIYSFIASGLSVGSNNNAVVIGKSSLTSTVGKIYYTNKGTYPNNDNDPSFFWKLATIHGISGTIPLINDVFALDELHGMAVGNNGLILYSNNGFQDWYVISQDWLRCFGNPNILNVIDWSGVSIPDSSTFILTKKISIYDYTVSSGLRIGSSDQYIFYLPNLFGILDNDLLDISGNIRMDGFLRIGNLSEKSIQTTGGINTGGNIVVQGSIDVYNNLAIRGNLVLNKDIILSGNLLVSNSKIVIARSPDSGNGTGAIAIGDNAGENSQGEFAISIGSNAGRYSQKSASIAIGYNSGNSQQGVNSIALGENSGQYNQGNKAVAIGYYSGNSGQNNGSLALGNLSGKLNQGSDSLAFGTSAGEFNQRDGALAFGNSAGQSQQGKQCIALGENAGQINQGMQSLAMGANSGYNQQGGNSVAIGYCAGRNSQGVSSVAIGYYAGQTLQGNNSIAIGQTAGDSEQGNNAVAFGNKAGNDRQKDNSIAIGFEAGQNQQNISSIAIGKSSGTDNQGCDSIAIGSFSANYGQGGNTVAIGTNAGQTLQGNNAVAIGSKAGQNSQGTNAVAIGNNAGQTNQSSGSVAIGQFAGASTQGGNSVAIGGYAGFISQGGNSVAIGSLSGNLSQGQNAVAIGYYAGKNNQLSGSIAIGYQAGQSGQGQYAISIGYRAGQTGQHTNSIILNASGSVLTSSNTDALYIKPIRAAAYSKILYYDTTGGEVSYGDLNPYSQGDINVTNGNVYVKNNIKTKYIGAKNELDTTYVKIYTDGTISATGGITCSSVYASAASTFAGMNAQGITCTSVNASAASTFVGMNATVITCTSVNASSASTFVGMNATVITCTSVNASSASTFVGINNSSSEIISTASIVIQNDNANIQLLVKKDATASKYAALYTDGRIKATGKIEGASFNATSDRRLKGNVSSLGSTLDKINQLEPVQYEWKNSGDKDFGFIAQDFYKIFPDLTPKGLQGEEPMDEKGLPKYYTIDYGKITCFLTKAIQELSKQRDETGIHGRSTIPENQQDVVITLHKWNAHSVFVVQITPIDGNRVLSSSPVNDGCFTVSGEAGEFYWSVFPETSLEHWY